MVISAGPTSTCLGSIPTRLRPWKSRQACRLYMRSLRAESSERCGPGCCGLTDFAEKAISVKKSRDFKAEMAYFRGRIDKTYDFDGICQKNCGIFWQIPCFFVCFVNPSMAEPCRVQGELLNRALADNNTIFCWLCQRIFSICKNMEIFRGKL